MRSLSTILNLWPVPIAALASIFMFVAVAAEQTEIPSWLKGVLEKLLPEAPPPTPDTSPEPPALTARLPYAPAPGRDDRTPVPFLSHVFGLNDVALPAKLSGIGPVFWDHAGQGTGALIAPDVVLTTAHLFAERGKWDGPFDLSEKPPAPSDGRIYLAACDRAYDFKAIELGSLAPRDRLGLDYAIAVLAEPACEAASVLPVALTPNDLAGADDQVLLNIGAYRFSDLPRYAHHPLYTARPTSGRFARYDVFGVRCEARGRESTGDVGGKSTGLVITSGCDGVPGGSGGPLLVSRDGGSSYSIVGVANSYRKADAEYNNYTAVEGVLADHLKQFVPLVALPDATSVTPPTTRMRQSIDPVLHMRHFDEETDQ